jgi:hypothetical protein
MLDPKILVNAMEFVEQYEIADGVTLPEEIRAELLAVACVGALLESQQETPKIYDSVLAHLNEEIKNDMRDRGFPQLFDQLRAYLNSHHTVV